MPPIQVAEGTVRGGIALVVVDARAALRGVRRAVQFVRSDGTTGVVNVLRKGIAHLEEKTDSLHEFSPDTACQPEFRSSPKKWLPLFPQSLFGSMLDLKRKCGLSVGWVSTGGRPRRRLINKIMRKGNKGATPLRLPDF